MGWKEYSDKLKEWYGYSEAKNQDDIIIDIYNSQRPAGSYKMSHTDPWCHATVSAAAYASGNAGSVPNTCYCPTGIQTFKQWGRWTGRQADTYNPQPRDIVYYDWNHDQVSDHVGTVIVRNGNTLVVREGNRNDMLCDRQIDVNSSYIMGYGIPRWDEAVKETVTDNPAGTTGNHTKLSVDTDSWIARVQAECNKQGFSSQKVDGIAGKNTLAGCPTIRKGAKGNLTALVQEKLNATGYECGKVDGIFGGGTEKAVKNLQKVTICPPESELTLDDYAKEKDPIIWDIDEGKVCMQIYIANVEEGEIVEITGAPGLKEMETILGKLKEEGIAV